MHFSKCSCLQADYKLCTQSTSHSLKMFLILTAPKTTMFVITDLTFVCLCVCSGLSLCRECVGQRCRVLRLKNQLNEDYKEVSNLVKRTLR